MPRLILAHDLGTGGNKAVLFEEDGNRIASVFEPYETLYPAPGRHEQRPADWWSAVVRSTRRLMAEAAKKGVAANDVTAIAVSGHSLGCVPLDETGYLLRETTPIWSDSRANLEADDFFKFYDQEKWYLRTGCGFPPQHYTLFKILWYQNNEPQIFEQIDKVIGTKDYVNYKMTGVCATDFSYASGSGAYALTAWKYDEEIIHLSGLPRNIFPEIVPSTKILGPLTPEAAKELGLSESTLVAAGGVDNSCMALGAGCFLPGRLYASLGSSSWVAVCDSTPLLEARSRPYVFTHVVPKMFASALAIFSSGTSFRWVRDQLCRELVYRAEAENRNVYELMIDEARKSPPGANGLLFNPSLSGGSSLDLDPGIRGAFLGMDLSHTRADVIRAAMEGIALNLRCVLDAFRKLTTISSSMGVVGGGGISDFWRQIYADALRIEIEKTNIGQDAAALGAAALAAVGSGLWTDFSKIDSALAVEARSVPQEQDAELYDRLLKQFQEDSQFLAKRRMNQEL